MDIRTTDVMQTDDGLRGSAELRNRAVPKIEHNSLQNAAGDSDPVAKFLNTGGRVVVVLMHPASRFFDIQVLCCAWVSFFTPSALLASSCCSYPIC